MTASDMSPLQCKDPRLAFSRLAPELGDASCVHCCRVEERMTELLENITLLSCLDVPGLQECHIVPGPSPSLTHAAQCLLYVVSLPRSKSST